MALTGSDTSSNVLFGSLQQITAQQAGADPDPHRGREQHRRRDGQDDRRPEHRRRRRRDGQQGNEGEILRYVFWHCVALACLVGVLVFLQSNLLSWMIPG